MEQNELYVDESSYEKPENVVLSAELMKQFEKERENIQKKVLPKLNMKNYCADLMQLVERSSEGFRRISKIR